MNFGGLGGGAAAGFTQGTMQGWGFVDKAAGEMQNRKLRELEYAKRSNDLMQQMQQEAMKNYAMQQYSQKTGAGLYQDPTVQALQQANNENKKKLAQLTGKANKNFIQEYLKASPEDRAQLIGQAQSDPTVTDGFKVKNPKTLRVMSWDNPTDRRDIQAYYARVGGGPLAQMDPTTAEKWMERQAKAGYYVSGDGHVVNVNDLAKGVGVHVASTPEDNREAVARRANPTGSEQEVKQTEAKIEQGKSSKGVAPATSEVAPIEPENATSQPEEPKVGNTVLDSIAKVEGTTDEQAQAHGFKSGYDVPIGYGKYGKPPKPLTDMTLGEVYQYQKQLKQHPENKNPRAGNLPSSAVGRYQFVEGTLKDLAGKLGLDENTKFTPEVQDALAMALYKEQGTKPWEGFTRNPQAAEGLNSQYASSQPGQPQTGSEDWMNAPYGNTGAVRDKWDLYSQLLGFRDNRPADVRTMDYIADRMGPGATTKDVFQAYQQMQQSKSSDKQFDWEAQISEYNQMIDEKVAQGQLSPDMAKIMKDNNKKEILMAKARGTGYNADMAKANSLVGARQIWDKVKTNPNEISQPVLNRLQTAELMASKPLETKRKDQLSAYVDLTERANKIAKKIDEVGPDNFFRGDIQGAIQWAATRDPEAINALSSAWNKVKETVGAGKAVPKEKIEEIVNNTVGLESELGMLVSDYLRAQSGTAVAEPEFVRLIGGVLAGLQSQNPEITKKALRTFADVNAMSARQKASQFGDEGYAYTAATALKGLGTAYSKYGYNMPDSAKMHTLAASSPKVKKEPEQSNISSQLPDGTQPDEKTVVIKGKTYKIGQPLRIRTKDGKEYDVIVGPDAYYTPEEWAQRGGK